MIPDIKIKEYYLRYIFNAERDSKKYEEDLIEIEKAKNSLYDFINENKSKLYNVFDIDLECYSLEFKRRKYNPSETLYKQTLRLIKTVEDENKVLLFQLLKYCYRLKDEYDTNKLIYIANRRKELSFKDYKEYVNKYYLCVHKALLEGYGYKFAGGIGTLIINYYKIDNPVKPKIDYAETNRRKKEIIAKGLKPYDEKEAAWYKARNIPYDGVEYRVYLNKRFCYDITFVDSKIFHKRELDYQRTEYVHAKLRGLSYQEMADKYCNTFDDIINLNVDIKYKLNIFLYKFPEKYLNFVRNAEQSKYKY